jgi:hypothetical protein
MARTIGSLSFFLFLLLCSWFSSSSVNEKSKAITTVSKKEIVSRNLIAEKLKQRSADAVSFATKNGYNTSICFLIDMSLSSGENRFFVYDMIRDSIQYAGLVTHGRCNQMWLEGRRYSNVPGCGCTSLGKYRIGYSYNGTFSLAYKLYGLEKTNNNAFKRYVVLHSHECVPENESQDEICQSDGCPTVSPNFLKALKPVIDNSTKPVLLWIFE